MTNYSRGANFEREVKLDLQSHGWFVVRSAGSHGPVDLVAQCPGPVVAWVQCKRDGKLSADDWQALVLLASAFDAIPIMAYKDDGIKYGLLKDRNVISDWHPGGEI